MRSSVRRQTVGAVGFLLALVAAWLAAGFAASASTPTLRPITETPLVLSGTGFDAGEAVRVELAPGIGRKRAVKTVRASAAGRFRVAFGLVALEPCRRAVVAVASGSDGSRATWSRPCRPDHGQPP